MVVFSVESRRLLDKRLSYLSELLVGHDGATPCECGEGVAVHVDRRATVETLIAVDRALRLAFLGLQFGKSFDPVHRAVHCTTGDSRTWSVVLHLSPARFDAAAKALAKGACYV